MNAVEIEEAVSRLAEAPFDTAGFPYAFLEGFGNKATTIQRLKSGATNQSDIGGVLQRNNIHLKVCAEGDVTATLAAPCHDFDHFRPIFEKAKRDLEMGDRQTLKYQDYGGIKKGDLFILDGQAVMVADMGDPFVSDYGRPDRRLRVVYDNGTESDLLLRSLQRALNKDKVSRRITDPDLGPLFSDVQEEDDLPTGYIYVLQSKSEHPFVAQNRSVLHKIGVTGGDVKPRIANAKKAPTFLLADVEIVAIYKLANINRTRLEALLHKFFGSARLDLELQDRFGFDVSPREWFLVPFPVIEEAIEKLKNASIERYRYDPQSVQIVERAK